MAACGSDFTVAVTEDGELFAWGDDAWWDAA
jgi:alpha-tubulin suppressor-like RCC1 family protein